MVATAALDPKLEPIVGTLVSHSNGVYDEFFIRELVFHVSEEFRGAPVQDYVAVLVAKEATDELRRLRGLRPIA